MLVGTASGLYAGSGSTVEPVPSLAGHRVGPFARHRDATYAVVDRREVWRDGGGRGWERVATWDGHPLTCVAAGDEAVLVGTVEAHVLRLAGAVLEPDADFDGLPERDDWYTPWGAPADVRSIAASGDRAYVNVHVGGIAARRGRSPWRAIVDIDVDVHQVVVGADAMLLAATGAAGLGTSIDDGASWSWHTDGLHGTYLRAVAIAGGTVLVAASSGPFGHDGAVYRRALGGGSFVRCSEGIPATFDGNVDTHWLAARGSAAAALSPGGDLYVSTDEGASWTRSASSLGDPAAVTFTD